MLMLVVHQHRADKPERHWQNDPWRIGKSRPFKKLHWFQFCLIQRGEIKYGKQRHDKRGQQHKTDEFFAPQLQKLHTNQIKQSLRPQLLS